MTKLAVNKFLDENLINNNGSISGKAHSVLDMIIQADLFVQIIMAILVFLSLVTWTIVFNRYFLFKRINRELKILSSFLSDNNFNLAIIDNNNFSLIKKLNFFGEILLSIYNKIYKNHKSEKKSDKTEMMQDIEVTINDINSNCEENLFWLGTIASASPFIGLLGTVWGIMNSFQSIAYANNSSINAVAPGIAEALLATALGLVVAIPALMFNNWIYNKLEHLNDRTHNLCKKLIFNLDL
jgi:biopolymer transport protein TolQ